MPDRFQETHIRRVPIFRDLPQAQFEMVAQAFQVRRYNVGEIILAEGQPTRGMHIIVGGQAVLLQTDPQGRRRSLGAVREGQFINQEALFRDGVESATLQAVQPVTALLLTRQDMANLLAYNSAIAQSLGLVDSRDHHMHKVYFKTQRANEQVLLFTRRHWWAYVRWLWFPLLIATGFWGLIALMPVLTLLWIVLSIALPGAIGVFLYLEWANDAVIVTDQRVVRITHTILTFSEVVSEIALESIQEANAEIPSLDPFALLFRYGDVELRTAGSQGNLMLQFVPKPQDLQDLILEDARNRQVTHHARERQSMRAEVDRWIEGSYAGQQPPQGPAATKKQRHEVNIDRIQNFWTLGSGPLSPFITSFPSDDGGIVYRKHWVVWFRRVFLPFVWLFTTAVFAILLLTISFLQSFGIIGWAFDLMLFLIGALWLFFADWDWRHDYYVIGDTNITIINQRPLWLQNENDQVLLKQVDNVVAESRGVLQRLFRFGDVKISLVGADDVKIFDDVGEPLLVQGEISRRQALIKQRESEVQQHQQREIIGEYLSLYHEQSRQGGAQDGPVPNPAPTYDAQQQPPRAPRLTNYSDGNRPPSVPRIAQNPSISSGRPYQPGQDRQQTGSRPDYAPDAPNWSTNPPYNHEGDSGRPPKFPRRRSS